MIVNVLVNRAIEVYNSVYDVPGNHPNYKQITDSIIRSETQSIKRANNEISLYEEEYSGPAKVYGGSYYTDMVYSYKISPIGTKLVHRAVSYDPIKILTGSNISKGYAYFPKDSSIVTAVGTLISMYGVSIAPGMWLPAATISNGLSILGIVISVVYFIQSATVDVGADEWKENHKVDVRLGSANGSLYESAIVLKRYHTCRLYSTDGSRRYVTLCTQMQYAGVWGNGFDVAQEGHRGGDAY